MTVFLSNRDGNGKTSEEGHYRLQTSVLKGFSLKTNDLKVVPTSPVGMSIAVSPGDYRLENTQGYSYTGWIDSLENIAVPTADVANPRIDAVVLYVDKSATTSPSPPNNPGVTKVAVIAGTPAPTPAPPSAGTIQSAVGASNPYSIIATVAVVAGASSISAGNITDLRTPIGIDDTVLSNSNIKAVILPIVYPVGSLYFNVAVSTSPATLLGFGVWSRYGQGRVLVSQDGTQSEFDTLNETGGAKTHTLSWNEMPAHSHPQNVTANAGPAIRRDFQSDGGGGTYAQGVNTGDAGGNQAHNNLQPYIVVYMWQRIA